MDKQALLQFIGVVYLLSCGYFTYSVRNKSGTDHASSEPLTQQEKIAVWIFCLINPIIGSLIMYTSWKSKFPVKAGQVHKIGWLSFGVLIVLMVLYTITRS